MSGFQAVLGPLLALLLIVGSPSVASAQKGSGSGSGAVSDTKARPLPSATSALTPDEIAALKQGHGMGFALAAELNGWPGPAHVLEHEAELRLTADQKARVKAIHDAMRKKAIAAGSTYIAAEERLADAFRSGAAQAVTLARLVRQVEEARADLRLVHLTAHLDTAQVLSAEQRRRYQELRANPARPSGARPK